MHHIPVSSRPLGIHSGIRLGAFDQPEESTMTKFSMSWRPLAALSALALIAGCSTYGEQPMQSTRPSQPMSGSVMTNASGMTLYTYDKDDIGKSNCDGACAIYWPPLLAGAAAAPSGALTLVTREDGEKQWANDGKPLYTFAKDKKAGEINGDGNEGVWHVIR